MLESVEGLKLATGPVRGELGDLTTIAERERFHPLFTDAPSWKESATQKEKREANEAREAQEQEPFDVRQYVDGAFGVNQSYADRRSSQVDDCQWSCRAL